MTVFLATGLNLTGVIFSLATETVVNIAASVIQRANCHWTISFRGVWGANRFGRISFARVSNATLRKVGELLERQV